jgi:hypothetical protein
MGYWLHPEWTGRGLATMSAAALLHQRFALAGIDRIEIHHDAANLASGAIPRRLGFIEVERRQAPDGPATPGEVGVEVIWRAPRQGHRRPTELRAQPTMERVNLSIHSSCLGRDQPADLSGGFENRPYHSGLFHGLKN